MLLPAENPFVFRGRTAKPPQGNRMLVTNLLPHGRGEFRICSDKLAAVSW